MATKRERLPESHDALSWTLVLRHFITESEEKAVGCFIKFLNHIKPRGVGNLLKESWSQQILMRVELGIYINRWNLSENKYKVLIYLGGGGGGGGGAATIPHNQE